MLVEPLGFGGSRRHWPEPGEFPEILDGCGEVELIFGAGGSSEAETIETDDAFEVGK